MEDKIQISVSKFRLAVARAMQVSALAFFTICVMTVIGGNSEILRSPYSYLEPFLLTYVIVYLMVLCWDLTLGSQEIVITDTSMEGRFTQIFGSSFPSIGKRHAVVKGNHFLVGNGFKNWWDKLTGRVTVVDRDGNGFFFDMHNYSKDNQRILRNKLRQLYALEL